MVTPEQSDNLPAPNARGLAVAIVGAGLMGHALAAIFAAAGSRVTLCETYDATLASAKQRMRASLEAAELDPNAADAVHLVNRLDGLDPECRFVTEAISEDLRLKQELFRDLETRLPHALLASNTSVLSIGEVAKLMKSPERLLGTHWWNPPYLIPLVEVVQGPQTRLEYIHWTMALLKSVGKSPVHVKKDKAGFIGNRLQHALWREAFALLEEGICDAQTVDFVARNTLGLKLGTLGPIENADYVGLDLTLAIHRHVFPALSRADQPLPSLTRAVAEGKLGAKTGEGMLTWAPGAREEVARRLNQYVKDQVKKQAAQARRDEGSGGVA
jgi:3-hydroxybutyryl-CoA dehydrogenase